MNEGLSSFLCIFTAVIHRNWWAIRRQMFGCFAVQGDASPAGLKLRSIYFFPPSLLWLKGFY